MIIDDNCGNYIFTADNITATNTYTISSDIIQPLLVKSDNKSMSIKGDVLIDGELTVGNNNITKTLEKICERLLILKPNERLENKWEELKELGDKYRALEKELLKKEELWNKIKS
jgi:hypothetical protein